MRLPCTSGGKLRQRRSPILNHLIVRLIKVPQIRNNLSHHFGHGMVDAFVAVVAPVVPEWHARYGRRLSHAFFRSLIHVVPTAGPSQVQ